MMTQRRSTSELATLTSFRTGAWTLPETDFVGSPPAHRSTCLPFSGLTDAVSVNVSDNGRHHVRISRSPACRSPIR